MRSATTRPRARRRGQAVEHEARELGRDPLHRNLLLAMPARRRVRHAEDGERRQPGIEIVAKLSAAHARLDDVLEDAFEAARPLADAAAAFVRQVLPLVEEDLHEVAAVDQRPKMRSDQAVELVAGTARRGRDRLGGLEEALHALEADLLEGALLGRK